jgi:hypothetical protein
MEFGHMGTWNIKEFKDLCKQANRDGAKFAESLAVRFMAARDYHQKNIFQKLEEAKSLRDSNDLCRLDYEIAWELDAFMNALNSIFDFLAQLINECLRKPKLDVAKVDPCRFNWMRGNGIADSVSNKFEDMVKDKWFTKIHDYCNVSKHHYAIKGDVNVEFGDARVKTWYYTKEFDFKQRCAQHISASELKDYLVFVGNYVNEIGVLLNHELSSRGGH